MVESAPTGNIHMFWLLIIWHLQHIAEIDFLDANLYCQYESPVSQRQSVE